MSDSNYVFTQKRVLSTEIGYQGDYIHFVVILYFKGKKQVKSQIY
jgi:hypothetical protein